MNLRKLKYSRVMISKMAIVFFKFQQKIPKYETFLKTQKKILSETLSELNFI